MLNRIFSLDDFEAPARRRIPRPIFGYVASGADREASVRGNRQAFDDLAFVPQAMRAHVKRDQKIGLFGHTYDSPFGFAPMGGISLAAYQGDLVVAREAEKANVPMILSGGALTRLEDVRKAGGTTWFQAYLPGDEEAIRRMLERVAAAGYETLVVTVDIPVPSYLEYALKSGFHRPFRPSLRLAWDGITRPRWLCGMFLRTLLLHGMPYVENMTIPRSPMLSTRGPSAPLRLDTFGWQHLELVRSQWKGSLVVKGILNRYDAHRVKECGADGIIVSNHGGRQLDGAIAPMRVLPGIVEAASGLAVMLDSGIRRGTDVLKALGLGAKFVFVGRPILYAAAVGGADGVAHAVRLLRAEIDRDMALVGIGTLAEMTRERLAETKGFDR